MEMMGYIASDNRVYTSNRDRTDNEIKYGTETMHFDAVRPFPSIASRVTKTHPGVFKEDKRFRMIS